MTGNGWQIGYFHGFSYIKVLLTLDFFLPGAPGDEYKQREQLLEGDLSSSTSAQSEDRLCQRDRNVVAQHRVQKGRPIQRGRGGTQPAEGVLKPPSLSLGH